jgi:uncharacterized membrane protein YphA (DoxX/SURF4 family)
MMSKYEVGSLILRFVLGISFFIHGVAKFQAGIGNIAGWFDSIGLPGFLAYIIATVELIGGIALILGLFSRIISLLFAVVMLGAIFIAKLSAGFLNGFELELAYLAMGVYIAITGSKAYALDSIIFKKEAKESSTHV